MPLSLFLCRGIQHIFDEDAVALGGIIYENVGDGADEVAVLDNGATGHADVKHGINKFCVFLRFLCVFTGRRQVFTRLTRDP